MGGFATIAGPVMGAFISFGIPAAHLISASVMSAPAALAYAKLIYPEVEVSETTHEQIRLSKGSETGEKPSNIIDAATQGAVGATRIVQSIVALLISCIAFVALLNSLTSFFFGIIGLEFVTFEYLLGKCFIPFAFIMGIEWQDCEKIGYLIGIKVWIIAFSF